MLKPLSVSQISEYVCKIFEAEELLQNVKVYGEISGLKEVRGNYYFNLKDENSVLSCIMFNASSFNFKEGDQILATGSLGYYSKGGKLNFYVTSAVLNGSGLLYLKFIELKNKLELEGVFDKIHKKPIPENIKTIGVITSKTGAVLHDIETVSHRRNPSLNIIVYPAKVQGQGAERTIINGLKYFDKCADIDVIIIARGGGSIEDLQPFNTEILAREIIKVSKTVISAVGHETDFTICDFASSIRVATPSVAGELVSKNLYSEFDKIKINLKTLNHLIFHLFDLKYQKLDAFSSELSNKIVNQLDKTKWEFLNQKNKLSLLSENLYLSRENKIKILSNNLMHLNPLTNLEKGWVKVYKENKNLKSINDLTLGDNLKIEFFDGSLFTKVTKILNK